MRISPKSPGAPARRSSSPTTGAISSLRCATGSRSRRQASSCRASGPNARSGPHRSQPIAAKYGLRMPLLFSYGTLQQDDVQRATFGGCCTAMATSCRDKSRRWSRSRILGQPQQSAGRITPTSSSTGAPIGACPARCSKSPMPSSPPLTNTAPASYERVAVRLASGKEAWVYVHAPTSARHS